MTRSDRIEAAALVAMHWFDPRGEGQHQSDPDLSPRELYLLLRDALEPDDHPHLRRVA